MFRHYTRLRHSLYWDETECLNYYGMLSLHEIFEIVGSQLTETDVEVLSFLLDETFPGRHPLDPAGWRAELGPEDANANVGEPPAPAPALLNAWRRIEPRGSVCPIAARHRPKTGTELLLELEKRGYLSEESVEPLLQLLRVLTRHDLLHLVSRKKRRTDFSPPSPEPAKKKRKRKRLPWTVNKGHKTAPPPPEKASCDVRLRVRAEYLQQESALRNGVISDKQQPLERQFELFSRASSLLRELEVGSVVCDIKFTELDNLEAFWSDYLRGALLEALKGVFITDWMRSEAGPDGVRLLISVDQDDYEEGRLVLMAGRCRNNNRTMPNPC